MHAEAKTLYRAPHPARIHTTNPPSPANPPSFHSIPCPAVLLLPEKKKKHEHAHTRARHTHTPTQTDRWRGGTREEGEKPLHSTPSVSLRTAEKASKGRKKERKKKGRERRGESHSTCSLPAPLPGLNLKRHFPSSCCPVEYPHMHIT